MLSDKIKHKVILADQKLNVLSGWEENPLMNYFDILFKTGSIEVGYRSQCGSTHRTQKVFSEFNKIIKLIRKDGVEIEEINQKHKNGYATINQGFWNSVIFKLIN